MEKKNQHYVPQFCLRQFASDSSKGINIYNFKLRKIIRNSSIKHQASEDYFYSRNTEIEKSLADLERCVYDIYSNCMNNLSVPMRNSEQRSDLILFISILYTRTLASLQFQKEAYEKLIKILHGKYTDFNIGKNNVCDSDHVLARLSIGIDAAKYLDDLDMKLLKNETNRPLVYSDNPVILYNQFTEQYNRMDTGYISKGLEVILPLSFNFCLLLYDSSVYKIGTKKSNFISITREKDVDYLNALQFLSAHENVYFSNECSEIYINNIAKKYSNLRSKEKNDVIEYKSISDDKTSLLTLESKHIFCKLRLSFVKFLKKSKSYIYDTSIIAHKREKYVNVNCF